MVTHKVKEFEKALGGKRTISLVFLGIGLALFIMNIGGLLSYSAAKYSFSSFDISVFSSMIIILYSVYMLYLEK